MADWAEANIVLSSEYAARASSLKLFGWQREPMNCFSDPEVQELVLCTGTQLIKTLVIQTAIAYVVSEDPGPILLIEPKEDACLAFSKRRLAPMIRDCACLTGKISNSLHGKQGSTLLSKDFPGGNLLIVSANTPTDLAQHTIRYVFCDEPDKYPASAGKEGDPMDLAWERAATFMSRKKRILACSPTVEGLSRIGKAYKASDQRKPWVPCWKCGQYQLLVFSQVKWDSSLSKERSPATAHYECLHCQAHWTDIQRQTSCNKAEWRAEKPFAGIAGFWISHLYSPWKKLSEIVSHFLKVKDDRQQFQVFVNTVLAEEWQETGETPDADVLYGRREGYGHGLEEAVVPQRGLFLTAAVDVQDNPPRLEYEVVAWGRGRENWSVAYGAIQCFAQNGQPLPVTSRELWDKLDQDVLQKNWLHESGKRLSIMAMGIDTGNRPKPVYEFARRHPQLAYSAGTGLKAHAIRTVVPVKGTPDILRIISSVSKEDASRQRQGVRIVGIGTHCAKQEIYDLLKHSRPSADSSPVPGCYHFPLYDLSYFNGLCSEVRIVKDNGKVEYVKRAERNEPIDLKVYNRGMASVMGIDRFNEQQWQTLEAMVAAPPPEAGTTIQSEASLLHTPPGVEVIEGNTPVASTPPVPPKPAPRPPAPRPTRRVRGSFFATNDQR